MQLPVDDVRGEFIEALGAARPVVLTAPTGSGKSTRLPLWMADVLDGPVLVVEPRRVACRSLAGWLSEQRDEPVGTSIGYTVRFDDCTSPQTDVVFATTGVALRMLSQNGAGQNGAGQNGAGQNGAGRNGSGQNGDGQNKSGGDRFRFAGVLVDEFHERSWQVDLILAIIRARRGAGEQLPLVITSATLDAKSLSDELDAHVIEASGRAYPVDVSYVGEPKAPSRRDLDKRVANAVKDALDHDPDGDILVFLPGKGEIADCESALSKVVASRGAEAVAVHGGLPAQRMKEALGRSQHKRRVYLSTNVAETSVTLPGVTTVIDSGLARMRIHRGGRSALALVPIAQDSMDQRAGRAGRVRPGRCVRLWSERFRPQEVTAPEIERIELDDVLLHAGVCGLEGRRLDQAPWVTEPPAFALEEATRRLVDVGAFDRQKRITDKGRKLAELPVDGHDARMLIGVTDPGVDEAMAGLACDLVAMLQLNRPLMLPTKDRDVHRARAEACSGLDNEVYVEIEMLRRGDPRRHKLHHSALAEARKVATSLRELVDAPVTSPTRDDAEFPDPKAFGAYLLERIPETAFVLRERAKRRRDGKKARPGKSEPWGNGQVELSVWPYQPPRLEHEDEPDAPVAGLVLDTFWIGDGATGVRGHGRMLLPCTYDQLADAGRGDETIGRVELRKGRTPRVVARVERELAGVAISSRDEGLRGTRLCEAVADLILENRLFKGTKERVLDDLHLWGVLQDWPDDERLWEPGRPPPAPSDYLAERLERLGLRSSEELALLEGDDLRPDLVDEIGVPAFELERFEEDFPRLWEHMGCVYACLVQPKTHKVILEPANKKARRAKDPKATHLPRFRGFSVYFRNASRVVPVRG